MSLIRRNIALNKPGRSPTAHVQRVKRNPLLTSEIRMRERAVHKAVEHAPPKVAPAHRSLESKVERFVQELRDVVELNLSWEHPMRLLLTHPRPGPAVNELHKAMRAILAETKRDETFVDLLIIAAKAARRQSDLIDFFEPIQLALLCLTIKLSQRPWVVMAAVWSMLRRLRVSLASAPSFTTGVRLMDSPLIMLDLPARPIVVATQRMISLALEELSIGSPAWKSWSAPALQAALEALWLAYTYCGIGVAGRNTLAKRALAEDLMGFGAPLWRAIAKRFDHVATDKSDGARNSAVAELARLAMIVGAHMPAESVEGLASASVPSSEDFVVCRSPIPESNETQDREEIAAHRLLQTPLATVKVPSPSTLEAAEKRLRSEFPWATSVLAVIFDDLIGQAKLGVRDLLIPPTLLVGAPGSGKSRLVRRLAESFDLPRLDVNLGGTSDSKVLSGTSRGWATGRPSDVVSLLARRRSASALVLLDEIDKAVGSTRDVGITSFLLGLLEQETACRFYDCFLKTECDLSLVSWICTANSIQALPHPLRSRLRILRMNQPAPEHLESIARGVLIDMEQRWRIESGLLPPLEALGIDFTHLSSARQVRIAVEVAVGRWSRTIVKH